MLQNFYLIYCDINNKEKVIMLCFSQACSNMNKPKK